jgi:AAA domain-containing protein
VKLSERLGRRACKRAADMGTTTTTSIPRPPISTQATTRVVRIAGVEVTPLRSGAFQFPCKAHGIQVTATLKVTGWTRPYTTCKECGQEALQPILDAIQAAQSSGHANGNGTSDITEWVQASAKIEQLTTWKKRIENLAYELLVADSEYHKAHLTADMVIEPLSEELAAAIQSSLFNDRFAVYKAPHGLTQSEIREEIDPAIRLAWKRFRIATRNDLIVLDGLMSTQDGDQVPAIADEYADRQAVDAFDAFQTMVGEARDYSWEGLIRVGCTAVLSALIGAGKTTLAMNLARAWGLGLSLFERLCHQSRTLVVVSPKEYEAWADTIGFWGLKGLVFLVKSTSAHFSDRAQTVKWFDYTMKKHECRTFVLDTLFDFFGMPPNTSGDANRIAMNEQAPLLELVRERSWSGLLSGHAPKSEAKAIDPRDPEESFGGHTAWTAQHRMRMTIRRKSQGVNAFITGRGGYGDRGILKEELLLFDEETRLLSLGGLFSDHLGEAAMPSVIDTMRDFGGPISMPKLIEQMGKSEKWTRAGVTAGRKAKPPLIQTDAIKGKRNAKYWLPGQNPDDSTPL